METKENPLEVPPWKYRRRLVYASWVLGCVMIGFGIAATFSDYSVATQLIVGGTAIVTVPLTAYVSWATLDDRWHYPSYINNINVTPEETDDSA